MPAKNSPPKRVMLKWKGLILCKDYFTGKGRHIHLDEQVADHNTHRVRVENELTHYGLRDLAGNSSVAEVTGKRRHTPVCLTFLHT